MADIASKLPIRGLSADTKVDVELVGGNSVSMGAGVSDSGTQRVTLPSDLVVKTDPTGTDKTNNIQFDKSSAVAVSATATHTFSPTANFMLQAVHCSASGEARFEIAVGTTLSEITKIVRFVKSDNQNTTWSLSEPLLVSTSESVKVTKLNMDESAQDLYTTIEGYDA